jgi:hypothetical protein
MKESIMDKNSPIAILQECAEMIRKKSNDYQNPISTVRQADYYPRGIASILDIIHAKSLRMRSVLDAMESDPNYRPNFESIEDSAKDIINYGSFLCSWLRGGIDGQSPDRDHLNRPKSFIKNKNTDASTSKSR